MYINPKEIRLGIEHAKMVWHSISNAQRRALRAVDRNGGKLIRFGTEYRHGNGIAPSRRIGIATVRALAAHELFAWDGGIPDPEKAAVVTERGRFVLAHGSQHSCRTCRK